MSAYQTTAGMSAYQTTLNLSNKANIQTAQVYVSDSTVFLSFGSNENVLITSTSTLAVKLPTPDTVTDKNIGCTFNIYKTYTGTNIITIIAPTGQSILGNGASGTTYSFGYNETYITVVCIDNTSTGVTWSVRSNGWFLSKSQNATVTGALTFSTNPIFNAASIPTTAISNYGTGLVDTTTNQTIAGIKTFSANPIFNAASIPTSAISGYASGLVDTTTNQTIAGIKTFTSNIILGSNSTPGPTFKVNLNYLPYESTNLLATATVLPDLPTLYGIYYFSSGASSTIITLPTIDSDNIIGCILHFKRMVNTVSSLIIKTAAGSGQTIVPRVGVTEISANTNYTFLSTTQYYGKVVASGATTWAVLI